MFGATVRNTPGVGATVKCTGKEHTRGPTVSIGPVHLGTVLSITGVPGWRSDEQLTASHMYIPRPATTSTTKTYLQNVNNFLLPRLSGSNKALLLFLATQHNIHCIIRIIWSFFTTVWVVERLLLFFLGTCETDQCNPKFEFWVCGTPVPCAPPTVLFCHPWSLIPVVSIRLPSQPKYPMNETPGFAFLFTTTTFLATRKTHTPLFWPAPRTTITIVQHHRSTTKHILRPPTQN